MQIGLGVEANTYGLTCGGCGHAISNHIVTTELNSSKVSGKCNICKCKGVSFA